MPRRPGSLLLLLLFSFSARAQFSVTEERSLAPTLGVSSDARVEATNFEIESTPPPPGSAFFPCPDIPELRAATIDNESVATDGEGYLIVSHALAQPLGRDGRPSGEARPHAIGSARDIDLEWGGDRYVATYKTGVGSSFFALSKAGEIIVQPLELPLRNARLAWNGSAGLILARGTFGDPGIYTVPITSDGRTGQAVALGELAVTELEIERFGSGYVAVFTFEDRVAIQMLGRDGAPVGGLRHVALASRPGAIRITPGDAGTLVVFSERSEVFRIKTFMIDPSGETSDPVVAVEGIGWGIHVAPTPHGFVLFTARIIPPTNRAEPIAVRLDRGGRPASEPTLIAFFPEAIAPAGSGRILFVGTIETGVGRVAATAMANADGTLVAPPQPAILGRVPQREARAASDGMQFAIAAITRTAAGDRIDAVRTDARSGARACLPVRQSGGVIQGIALAGSPAGFLLAWAEADVIHAALLVGDSWVELPASLALEGRDELEADLAWNGESFELTWVEGKSLRLAQISPSGTILDLGVLANGIFYAPRIASSSARTLIAVRTERSYPRWDTAASAGAAVVARERTGFVAVTEIEPIQGPTKNFYAPDIDVDIAMDGTTAVLALRRADEIHAVLLSADGTPLQRTKIAESLDPLNVAVAAVSSGFAIAWMTEKESFWPPITPVNRYRLFTASLDGNGVPNGDIRHTEGPVSRYATDAHELDLASHGFDVLGAWDGWYPAAPLRLDAMKAAAALVSTSPLHPGAPPAPVSPSIRATGPGIHEIQWTQVPGATAYVIEAWESSKPWRHRFTVAATENHATIKGTFAGFRIASTADGLMSEWIDLEPAWRRRMVAR